MLTYDVQGCTNAAVAGCAGVAGNNSYTYNANGELTGETLPTGTLRYAYNALGDLTDVTLGSKQIHYLYDGQNRLVGKEVNGKLTEGFLYDGQLLMPV